jgi:hypothetical protein
VGKRQTTSYRAVVAGDRIEWIDAPPTFGRLEVRVSLLPPRTDKAGRREAAIAALTQLAGLGGLGSIVDPTAWQRELRNDRPLPGRNS